MPVPDCGGGLSHSASIWRADCGGFRRTPYGGRCRKGHATFPTGRGNVHISRLKIENFRIFGSGSDSLELEFGPGLTLLVGPNDGGKTAIVDAIRFVVGTSARDWNRIAEDDFHAAAGARATSLTIACRFNFEDPGEASPFFEYVTPETGGPTLHLLLSATRHDGGKRSVVTDVRTGEDGAGPRPDGTMRALLAATYLRALRDAVEELSAGRASRFSQILHAHPKFAGQKAPDFDATAISEGNVPRPKTLVGIMRLAEHLIGENDAVEWTRDRLNERYLERFSVAGDPVRGAVGIRAAELRDILEKLDLWIASVGGASTRLKRGLGSNNILYMASEMLLIGASGDDGLPLLLIEEPEAHLHPQLQLLVGDFLREQSVTTKAKNEGEEEAPAPLQVVATTHSPVLASQVDLEQIVVVAAGKAYPLRTGFTALDAGDYRYLSKFLNATRANLFFARGVLIVEGDAENLLLPVLADLLGLPLNKHGVSIVNVGTVGLFRYSRIFQTPDGGDRIPVRVACITDLDLPHDADEKPKNARLASRKRNDGGPVKTFISDFLTLEYVLAHGQYAELLHRAIALARAAKALEGPVPAERRPEIAKKAEAEFAEVVNAHGDDRHALAAAIFQPLVDKGASKAEVAQYFGELLIDERDACRLDAAMLRANLPKYLVEAIEYATWADETRAVASAAAVPHVPVHNAVADPQAMESPLLLPPERRAASAEPMAAGAEAVPKAPGTDGGV
jgi:putative ATP-dependent endonuclease of OLD family